MVPFRRWLSRKLYLLSCRIYEDWHEIELIADSERIRFCCYGDFTGSWPERWEFSCSCERRATQHSVE
ncbi:hypothetical protein A4G28_26850 [Mycobacterium ostraviense]|uniref:Uncharacterized protein n=1 Tax=Mycobacterium ostraviense TaxID=2738409 RepID=A0A162FSV2_9MYCO|nr:hypothetical protein A4G28_26850 [Mycobacterium ostraviense]